MRVVIIPDREMVRRERALLSRLELGLADEGVRVLQAIPRSLDGHEAAATLAQCVFSKSVLYDDQGLPFTQSLRAAYFIRDVHAATRDEPGDDRIDVVYCLGPAAWGFARAVARALRAALLLEVFADRDILRAGAAWRRAAVERATGHTRPWFLTPGEPMARRLARLVPSERVAVSPWGVQPGDHAEARTEGEQDGPSVVLLAAGRRAPAVRESIIALGELARELPGLRVLADSEVARALPLWRWAKDAALRERLSILAEMEGRHDVLTHADVLLVPEALGEYRGMVLQAMADGMITIAAPDPAVDWFVPGETAIMLESATAGAIAAAVRAAAAESRGIRARSAAHVRLHWPASGHARAVLAACERAASERDSTARL